MQGETSMAKQTAPRTRGWGWMGTWVVAAFVAAGLFAGTAEAQRNKAPQVSLSASTTQIATGASAVLTAVATDQDGTIAKVEFYVGLTKVSTATAAPYRYTYTPTAAGTFTVWAVATDNMGAFVTSNTLSITVLMAGNQPPTVALALSATDHADRPVGHAFGHRRGRRRHGLEGPVLQWRRADRHAHFAAVELHVLPVHPGTFAITAVATDNQIVRDDVQCSLAARQGRRTAVEPAARRFRVSPVRPRSRPAPRRR